MKLLQKQQAFSRLTAALLGWLYENGYEVTFGETWRPPEEAARNAKEGDGIVNSLHCIRLAVDLNIWKDGVWLRRTEDIGKTGAGDWWELQSSAEVRCVWGGRFGDGNHFSVEHNGVR